MAAMLRHGCVITSELNDRRIAIGVLAWFLGIIVPVAHQAVLYHYERSDNVIRDMTAVFDGLPWVDFVYLSLMALTGLALVVSGFIERPSGGAG